jgi:hypothetical protein
MLPQLARFLNIDFVPGLQQATTAGMPASANSSFKKDALSGTILKSGEHLQREVFTLADKKLIAACVGREAGLLGYPMDKVGGFDKAYAHFRYALLH